MENSKKTYSYYGEQITLYFNDETGSILFEDLYFSVSQKSISNIIKGIYKQIKKYPNRPSNNIFEFDSDNVRISISKEIVIFKLSNVEISMNYQNSTDCLFVKINGKIHRIIGSILEEYITSSKNIQNIDFEAINFQIRRALGKLVFELIGNVYTSLLNQEENNNV